ncbi:type II toxin-antitoxin system PemK/MazF family toxin [Chamaesiphon minutus]|jgi:mRNA interferase MazF|uniref:PemK-like protein n=1 Tax=Chamaesiphon minutus (strain ATCC 27169 / PCC 6605) TaxID=1173020 RepID=K9UBV0_CHAP6|nr:type II toxin-antitoxin system PemK/MazF family toxin [Chamaesiphon minutus]AFY91906.1 PemK-like protein [Chamaesiphon minutus PCC 6605]
MNLAKGDVVLVPFPFTDLSQTKLRPAIVLYVQPEGEDITLCFISSQNLERVSRDELIIDPEHPEFAQTGLKSKSKVRVSRIVTLEKQLIKRKLGSLGLQLIENVDRVLVDVFLIK